MSGQQEPRGEVDQLDQHDARDATLHGLISGLGNGASANGTNGHGARAATAGGAAAAVVANGHGSLAAPKAEPRPVAPPARGSLARGSLADLRQRLERLPYGHPSSPYHVDGEPKPPPPRLKHLELAPSAPNRFTPAQSPAQAPAPVQPPVSEDEPIAASVRSEPAVARTPGQAALTEDQVRIADDAYDMFRTAEGRNLFGSYDGTGLTAVVREVAESLEYGELAPDSEQTCLIAPEVFKARFAAMLARYPDRTPELLARRIPGAISYSFIFDDDRYSPGIWMVQDVLSARGFQLLVRRNDWNSPVNRCVATMWHDHSSGLPFEVQFHTVASLEAQQLARSSASLISDPRMPSAEAKSLRSGLASAWAALPAPPGQDEIAPYHREAGAPPVSTPG